MDPSQDRLWNDCISATLVLGFQVFCDVTLCHWVRGFWHFKGSRCCNVERWRSQWILNWLILTMNEVQSFKASAASYPLTQHHSQKTCNFSLTWINSLFYYFVWLLEYDTKYLSTATGMTPGGSSTVHIYTQTIRRTTQLTNWEECGPCPVFARYTLAFALQLRKKHGKTSVGHQRTYIHVNIGIRLHTTYRSKELTSFVWELHCPLVPIRMIAGSEARFFEFITGNANPVLKHTRSSL